ELDRLDASFGRPTEAISLGAVAAAASMPAGEWTPAASRAPAERSQAIPMPLAPAPAAGANAGVVPPVPPVRAQTTRVSSAGANGVGISGAEAAPPTRRA